MLTGAIGVLSCGICWEIVGLSAEEADEYIKIGTLNGIFVPGREYRIHWTLFGIKRGLKQGLYRHPWDDISFISTQESS